MAVALAAAFAGTARAKPDPIGHLLCAPRAQMTDKLERQFGSSRQGMGVRSPDEIVEFWSEPDGAHWTLVISYASGTSCIVAMGEDWTRFDGAG